MEDNRIMKMSEDRDELFACECHYIGHVVQLTHFGPHMGDSAEHYVTFLLTFYKGFFRRLKSALKYIFLSKHEECDFDGWIFRTEKDYDRLIGFLNFCFPCKSSYDENEKCFYIEEENKEKWKYFSDLKFGLLDDFEENIIKFNVEKIEFKDESMYEELMLNVHFKEERNFFKRLYRGIKYIFGCKRSLVSTDLSNSHIGILKAMTERVKKSYDDYYKKEKSK